MARFRQAALGVATVFVLLAAMLVEATPSWAFQSCPTDSLCLYQSTNYAYGVVRLSVTGIGAQPDSCYDMSQHNTQFVNGDPAGPANNLTASWRFPASGNYEGSIVVYDSDFCNAGEGAGTYVVPIHGSTYEYDMHRDSMSLCCNMWHRPTSFQLVLG
jgi:hypothetical protein